MANVFLAIKLGSTTTTIFRQGDGLVLKEPSLIAVSGSMKNREIKAIGYEAARLVGRTTDNVNVVSPIANGLINNVELATAMLRGFIKKVCPEQLFKPNIKALICVPLGITLSDKKVIQKVCYSAGISDVTIIPAIICSAIGQDIDIENKYGKLIVNIGGGCTNIAVIANNTILQGISLSLGGSKINMAIEQYISEKYNIQISGSTAEKIKQEVSSLFENYSATSDIEGIDLSTKENQSLTIHSKEIFPIIKHYYGLITEAITTVINMCPPDIIGDVNKSGVYISGSQSTLPGLDKFFKKQLSIPAYVNETSKTDIWGASKLLDDPLLLKKILLQL